MRDYQYIDKYLDELQQDIYDQPRDEGHTELAIEAINELIAGLGCKSVLDVGCGDGFLQQTFETLGMDYRGITLGNEFKIDLNTNWKFRWMDFNFIWSELDEKFDLIFARHVLEHSPMPLLTLMDWHRISQKYLCIILPDPEYYKYVGRNHYAVMPRPQAAWLLRRAGWEIMQKSITKTEFRYLCIKRPRIGSEGWAESPVPAEIYEADRDS